MNPRPQVVGRSDAPDHTGKSMAVNLELAPKQKRPAGEACCEPVVYPDVQREQAERMAAVAKALGDPIRMQLVDVLRKACRPGLRLRARPPFSTSRSRRLPPPKGAA
jgi:ArsR family transcriptional regulator